MISRQLSVIYLLLLQIVLLFSLNAHANELESLRIWPSPDETRVVIDLSAEVEYSYFTLSSPDRVVVDLKNTSLNTTLPLVVSDSKVLSKIRKSSPPSSGTYRLVFELKSKVTPNLFKLAPTPGGQYGHRLVVDLPHEASTSSGKVVRDEKPASSGATKDASQLKGNADIVIAIDAGHGGEDPAL